MAPGTGAQIRDASRRLRRSSASASSTSSSVSGRGTSTAGATTSDSDQNSRRPGDVGERLADAQPVQARLEHRGGQRVDGLLRKGDDPRARFARQRCQQHFGIEARNALRDGAPSSDATRGGSGTACARPALRPAWRIPCPWTSSRSPVDGAPLVVRDILAGVAIVQGLFAALPATGGGGAGSRRHARRESVASGEGHGFTHGREWRGLTVASILLTLICYGAVLHQQLAMAAGARVRLMESCNVPRVCCLRRWG